MMFTVVSQTLDPYDLVEPAAVFHLEGDGGRPSMILTTFDPHTISLMKIGTRVSITIAP